MYVTTIKIIEKKLNNVRRIAFSTNTPGVLDIQRQKKEEKKKTLILNLNVEPQKTKTNQTTTTNTSKLIMDLNVNCRILKPLESKTGENL